MRYEPAQAAGDWKLLEVVRNGRHPLSEAYSEANDADLMDIFQALRLLRAAGQPPDLELGNPDLQKAGSCKLPELRRSVDVYVLKAKPSGWRLYFHVKNRENREIEFLHAVHKKRWRRDPRDFHRCENILADVFAGRTTSEQIYIPDR
jgi:hypothetical protein